MASSTPKRTLSGRLFAAFFSLSLSVLMVSVAAVVAASWTVYEGDAEQRLSSQAVATAQLLSQAGEDDAQAALESLTLADTRVTLVTGDGRVVFDNQAQAAAMPNHATREEIAAARPTGESAVLRRSETTGLDTLYVAVSVPESDYVVRLAEARTSLPSYLGRIAAPLAAILILALLLSLVFARFMARKIAKPLVDVDLDDPLACDAYAEVMPLLERVGVQKLELLQKNQELQSAVVMRREFTGNVSHEMKSPLQVIGGYAELIESGIASPEDVKRFAGLIGSEARSMRTLIDDVLTLSKLDEMQEDCSTLVDICAACGSAAARLSSAAESRGIRLTVQAEQPALVRGSASLAEQMVYNLIDNALRYGREAGRVEVAMDVLPGEARLVVSDDGPGVPPEARERIFERFYRVDSSRSRETGGTGLGLAIVKHAALSMGGSVQAGDSPLGGLAVTVRLPLAEDSSS